jgi:antitoxin ParD1/3/4
MEAAMRNTSVSLSDHFNTFIEAQIASGRYGSASEVVRAGLRLLEERAQQFETLRQALVDGENSGPATPLDMEEIKRTARERVKSSRAA